MKTFIFVLVLGIVFAQDYQDIECPVPGNPSNVDQTECDNYSACEFDASCSMRSNAEIGYVVKSVSNEPGLTTVQLSLRNPSLTLFNQDISNLTVQFINYEDYHLRVKIFDSDNDRYEVPIAINLPDTPGTNPLYSVEVNDVGKPFQFNITRLSTGNNIFQIAGPITFENQFIQLTTRLNSDYLYGIGEHSHSKLKHTFSPRVTYPLFTRDEPMKYGTQSNHYGAHPYYVNVEDELGNTHSVLFHNSNAMEYSLFTIGQDPGVTMRTIGGIVDLHFFLGPTPEDVNVQYATTIGKSTYPPYYAFGFTLCRWGYNTEDNYRAIYERLKAAGIPLNHQIFDIDYMDSYKDFTYDSTRWPTFPSLISDLKADGLHVSLILDPAIVIDDSYQTYVDGRDNDVFISWSDPMDVPSDQPTNADDFVVGYVWPEMKTVFPDFMKNSTIAWWDRQITSLINDLSLNFDGLWIDMNEPANFGTNLDRPWNYPGTEPDWSLKCPNNMYDDPPYPTMAAYQTDVNRLSDKTICMKSNQTDREGNNYMHYDVHNLYGYFETLATFIALEDLFFKQRPVILSRSTFPGSGRYAVHWLGDNTANWDQLKASIIGTIEFNMFAMPMVGADVCGFFDEPDEELCLRWTQAGAFAYPFNRNHNTNGTADQDPGKPEWDPTHFASVLTLRHKYIPFIYALFHRAHMGGGSVVRPLFNVFPTDLQARDVDDQLMWGDALMVAPVMEQGAVTRFVYFPEGLYYDLVEGTLAAVGPVTVAVSAPLEKIPVYLRGGKIIPYQEPASTTTQSRLNAFGYTVALNESLGAEGEIFWDDGKEEHVMSETYLGVISFSDNILQVVPTHNPAAADGLMLGSVSIFGFTYNPTSVTVNGTPLDAGSWIYDSNTSVLEVTVSVAVNVNLSMEFIQ